jgi:hypothetical protein
MNPERDEELEGSVVLAAKLTLTTDCLSFINNSGSNVKLIILLSSPNI